MARVIDTVFTYNEKEYHLYVTNPWGGGGNNYNVFVNDYLQGQIICRDDPNNRWGIHINSSILTSDDIGAILDELNFRHGFGQYWLL